MLKSVKKKRQSTIHTIRLVATVTKCTTEELSWCTVIFGNINNHYCFANTYPCTIHIVKIKILRLSCLSIKEENNLQVLIGKGKYGHL